MAIFRLQSPEEYDMIVSQLIQGQTSISVKTTIKWTIKVPGHGIVIECVPTLLGTALRYLKHMYYVFNEKTYCLESETGDLFTYYTFETRIEFEVHNIQQLRNIRKPFFDWEVAVTELELGGGAFSKCIRTYDMCGPNCQVDYEVENEEASLIESN